MKSRIKVSTASIKRLLQNNGCQGIGRHKMKKVVIILFLWVSATPAVFGHFECPQEAVDDYHRDPDDCSRFYRCYSGNKASFSCSHGLFFNTNNNVCDWPRNVECVPADRGPGASSHSSYETHGDGGRKPQRPEYGEQPSRGYESPRYGGEKSQRPTYENNWQQPQENQNPIYGDNWQQPQVTQRPTYGSNWQQPQVTQRPTYGNNWQQPQEKQPTYTRPLGYDSTRPDLNRGQESSQTSVGYVPRPGYPGVYDIERKPNQYDSDPYEKPPKRPSQFELDLNPRRLENQPEASSVPRREPDRRQPDTNNYGETQRHVPVVYPQESGRGTYLQPELQPGKWEPVPGPGQKRKTQTPSPLDEELDSFSGYKPDWFKPRVERRPSRPNQQVTQKPRTDGSRNVIQPEPEKRRGSNSQSNSETSPIEEMPYRGSRPGERPHWPQNTPRPLVTPKPRYQYPRSRPDWSVYEQEPRPDQDQVSSVSEAEETAVNRLFGADPYSMPDLMSQLKCADTDLADCTQCDKLSWLKFPKVFLRSTPLENIQMTPKTVGKDCFRRCMSSPCVAFSYSKSGTCFTFSGPIKTMDIIIEDDYETVIKEPKTALLLDSLLYTSPASPVGNEFASIATNDIIGCLRTCDKLGAQCKAIAFDVQEKICKLFDGIEGHEIGLHYGSIAIQWKSLFELNECWRFTPFGARRLNGTFPVDSFAIDEDQECFEECLKRSDCLLISIEGSMSRECHIYNKLSTFEESDKYKSYLIKTPRNQTTFLEIPNLYFSGTPVSKYTGFNIDKCREVAANTRGVKKVTFLVERSECFLFSDSALISLWENPELQAKSFLVNLPHDAEYLAFKRIPSLFIYSPSVAPLMFNDVSATKCLQVCLQQNCTAISVSYDIKLNYLECYILAESDMKLSPLILAKNNTEIFLRTLPGDFLSQPTGDLKDVCSKSSFKPDAAQNMVDFKQKSAPTAGQSRARSQEKPIKSAQYRGRSQSPKAQLLAPHGDDFIGLPDDRPLTSRRRRSLPLTVRGIDVYESLIQGGQIDEAQAAYEAGQAVEKLLAALLPSNGQFFQNQSQVESSRFINQFLEKIKLEIAKENNEFLANMMGFVRRARRARENGQSERLPCKVTRGSITRQLSCREEDMCREQPQVIFADLTLMSKCIDTKVNSSCSVACKSGYKSEVTMIKCEQIGSHGIWNTADVKCQPNEEECQALPWVAIKSKQGLMKEKLHYLVKYDEGRKLPVFSIYEHGPENDMVTDGDDQELEHKYTTHPCPQLKGHQLSNLNYKMANYSKGHLSSSSAFKYSKEAKKSANYFVNVAPQDPFTQDGPWKVLDTRLNNQLKKSPGFVVSGVCLKHIYLPFSTSLPVPKCFWKIVCTRTPSGEVTAAAFFHDNSHPISGFEKQARVEEVMSYTNQEFVKTLVGQSHFNSIWMESLQHLTTDRSVVDQTMAVRCGEARTVSPSAINFWNQLLTDPDNGPEWPLDFAEGLVPAGDDMSTASHSGLRGRSAGQTAPNEKCLKKIVAYISSNPESTFKPETVVDVVTHFVYAFVPINSNGSLTLGNDSSKAITRIYQLLQLKNKNKDLKVMFSVGGWDGSEHFSRVAANQSLRKNFVADIIKVLDYFNFDGVDIAWQYPVIGGQKEGRKEDKLNFNQLLWDTRQALFDHQEKEGRTERYLLSATGPGAYWILDAGFDVPSIVALVDWINVLSFDYFGAWKSSWGSFTGPQAPLFQGSPDGYPGKMNVDSTIKQYVCSSGREEKIVMGIPFYGRFWRNVGPPVKQGVDDNLFRASGQSLEQGGSNGGVLSFKEIKNKWLSDFEQVYHKKSQTPYLWSKTRRTLLSYENEKSVQAKAKYATDHRLGGVMLWMVDMDDDEGSLLRAVAAQDVCYTSSASSSDTNETDANIFKCNPLKEKQWFTQEDGNKDRMCGKLAPLINGFYPICDPDNSGYSCCSKHGFCGSGPDFCSCEGCTDYGADPEKALQEPRKPTQPVRWHTMESAVEQNKPRCGHHASKLTSGKSPICNPDDDAGHCCSATGFCGNGTDFCGCAGCVDFRNTPDFVYVNKTWWDWIDGPEKVGRCGKSAPQIADGVYPTCNPVSSMSYCCGNRGFCGRGSNFCDCRGCVNFRANPSFRWK